MLDQWSKPMIADNAVARSPPLKDCYWFNTRYPNGKGLKNKIKKKRGRKNDYLFNFNL